MPPPAADHSVVELPVPLSVDARRTLSLLLDGEGIGHEWLGPAVLRVPRASAARVEELIEFAGAAGEDANSSTSLDGSVHRCRPVRGARSIARVWERLVAAVFDAFFVGLVALPFAFAGLVATEVLVALDEIVLVTLLGATVGKLCFRLRIVRWADGERVRVGAAIVRWAVKAGVVGLPVVLTVGHLVWLGPALAIIDLAPLVIRDDNRALHDLVAGTVVVHVHP